MPKPCLSHPRHARLPSLSVSLCPSCLSLPAPPHTPKSRSQLNPTHPLPEQQPRNQNNQLTQKREKTRYIHHLLQTHLPPSVLLPRLLLALRTTLFPHSSLFSNQSPLPPPSTSPSDEEIKLAAARSLRSLIPAPLLARFFASPAPTDWDRAIEVELDVWADPYLNRHLAYAMLELVAVRLLPELGERGVRGLMEGRGVGVGIGREGGDGAGVGDGGGGGGDE